MMTVAGKWINSFGSVVWLEQDLSGSIFGVYSSTTGSSGAYWVVGSADPTLVGTNSPTDDVGQSVVLSIFWRSILGGSGDPSWHYVSSLSGQLVTLNEVPTLFMIHDMVATAPFPGVVPAQGSYLDKLLYTPANLTPAPRQWPPLFVPPQSPQAISGTWVSSSDPGVNITLTVQDEVTGYVTGTLQIQDASVPTVGFTDVYAGIDGLSLQGLTLSAFFPDNRNVAGLAGSLDLTSDVLSVSWLQSRGTLPGSTWIQTNLQCIDFVRNQ